MTETTPETEVETPITPEVPVTPEHPTAPYAPTMAVSVALFISQYSQETGESSVLLHAVEESNGVISYELPQGYMLVDEDATTCAYRLLEGYGIAKESISSLIFSRAFTRVDRNELLREIGLLFPVQLNENTTVDGKDLKWFNSRAEESKVLLSVEDETIIAYRDGHTIGDADLVLDHAEMITSVM